jgi:hypothetical protein
MPQGNAELMAKEQILGFKPARRLKEIDDVHRERMQEREHRPRSCDDSTRRCDSQAGAADAPRAASPSAYDQSWIPTMSFSGRLVVKWLASSLTDPWQFDIIGIQRERGRR